MEKDIVLISIMPSNGVYKKRKKQDKIYSIHESILNCIVKGKEVRKLEFGNKLGVVVTKILKIVVGVLAFEGNHY